MAGTQPADPGAWKNRLKHWLLKAQKEAGVVFPMSKTNSNIYHFPTAKIAKCAKGKIFAFFAGFAV